MSLRLSSDGPMKHDNAFDPKLGKIRSDSLRRGTFLRQVQRAIARASGLGRRTRNAKRQFDGSRIGRGCGTGRLLASNDAYNAFRGRRAVIKARLIRLGASNINGARVHVRYLQRDGVTRDGAPGDLYD